jgi:hypothetical protein
VVVGHSLGSLVAYDMLNGLFKEDHEGGGALRVAERTGLLLTFGSPLDKTAYVFAARRTSAGGFQDALAAVSQPMIVSFESRPHRWVNIYSPDDLISGRLDYYDDEAPEKEEERKAALAAEPQRIENRVDPEACTPLAAHNEYWRNIEFTEQLFHAVRAPVTVPIGAP